MEEVKELLTLEGSNVQMLGVGSPFAGRYVADDWTAYIVFDICHSFPVVAGPASVTGNYVGVHPAVLSKHHRGLVHKQTNLHHLVKFYDPKRIQKDRIMGVVVDAYYPPPPDEGWTIPESKEDAIPIQVCAAVFKQADGAVQMLEEHLTGKRKWSVSIEYIAPRDSMAVYIPSTRQIVPLDDPQAYGAVTRDKDGRLLIGKSKDGEQLAFAYGGENGKLGFQGVGYTPNPAEKEAGITEVHLSQFGAMEFMAADQLMGDAVSSRYPGAVVESIQTSGVCRLPGVIGLAVHADAMDPVLQIRLANGRRILKRSSQIA